MPGLHTPADNMVYNHAWKNSCDMSEPQTLSNTESLEVSAAMTSEYPKSAFIIDGETAGAGVDMTDFTGHANVEDLAPGQEPLSYPYDLTLTDQALYDPETPHDLDDGNDAVHVGNIGVLLNQALNFPRKHDSLPGVDHLTTEMARPVYDVDFDDDIRELQDATAAFLAEQYDNGEFVATPDDIVGLQEATAAFIDDRYDRECFRLDDARPGLLLPGKRFLVSTSTAVDVARAACKPIKAVVDTIDECLGAHLSCEDEPTTPLLDMAFRKVDMSKFGCASFDDLSVNSQDSRSGTPQLHERLNNPFLWERPYVARNHFPDLPDNLNQHPDFHDTENGFEDNDGESSDTVTDFTDIAFDAPDALSFSQASYAACFFDTNTETLVAYTSLDLLLTMDDEEQLLSCVYRALDDEDDGDVDGDHGIIEVGEEVGNDNGGTIFHLDDFCFDGNVTLNPPATRSDQRRLLEIVAQLPTIWEEDEPYSASMGFENHSGSREPPSPRRNDPLEDGGEVLAPFSSNPVLAVNALAKPTPRLRHLDVESNAEIDSVQDDGLLPPVSSCSFILHDGNDIEFSDLFAGDIWTNGPNLKFAFSDDQTILSEDDDGAGFSLSEFLTAVFEIVQTRSWNDVPAFGADLKQKLCSHVDGPGNLDLAERLEKIIDLTRSYAAAHDWSEPTMS